MELPNVQQGSSNVQNIGRTLSQSERSFHSSVRQLLLEAARSEDAASTTSDRPISGKPRSKKGSRTDLSDKLQQYGMLQRPLSPLRSGPSGETSSAVYTPMRTGTDIARKRRKLKTKSSKRLGMDHSLVIVRRLAQKSSICVAAVEPQCVRRPPTVARLQDRLRTTLCTCEVVKHPSHCKDCDRIRAEASLQRAQLQRAALENRVFRKKADRQLAAVREELRQYKKSLQTASDLQSMASEKLAALRAELSEAKQAHTQAEGVAKAMKLSLAGQQKSNASLQKTNESLRSSVQEKDGWIQSLQQELASTKASIQSREAAAQQADRSKQLLTGELDIAKKAAQQARSRNGALQTEVNELKRKLERTQSEVDSLREEASDQAELQASLDDWKDRACQAESREQFLKSKLGELIEKRKQDRVQMERTAAASAVSLHVTSPTVIVRVTNERNETADEQCVLPVLPRAEIREALIGILCSRTRIVARKGGTGGSDPRGQTKAGQSHEAEGPLHGARREIGREAETRDEAWATQVSEEMQGGILEALEPLFEKTGAMLRTEAAGESGRSDGARGRPSAAGARAGRETAT